MLEKSSSSPKKLKLGVAVDGDNCSLFIGGAGLVAREDVLVVAMRDESH